MAAATERCCAAWNTVTSTSRTTTSANAATHIAAPMTIRRWKMVAPSFMSLRRRLGVGVAQRRLAQGAVLAVARQLLERGELHGRTVVEAELALRQRGDAFGAGDARPVGLEHADLALLLRDRVPGLVEIDAGQPRLLRDVVKGQDRKPHQRDAEEIEDADHLGSPSGSDAFGRAQAGGARARIALGLGRAWAPRTGREKAIERRSRAPLVGRMARWPRGGRAALGQVALDDAVLERVEGDDDEPPVVGKHVGRRIEAALKLAQLVVHMDAQRLEGARRGMDGETLRRGAERLGHDLGQLRRACDRSGGGYCLRDAARLLLLAVAEDHVGEHALARGVDEIGGALAVLAHAHVERTVGAEREAALRLVELEGRDAEIEDDAAGLLPRDRIHRRERALRQREPALELRDQLLAARDGVGIAVDAEHAAFRGGKDRARIAAAAEGRVDVARAVARVQRLDDFVEHHGDVAAHAPAPVRCASARLRRSACTGAKRSLSQIWNLRPMPTKVTRSFSPACAIISSGRRTRPFSSRGKSCVIESTAKTLSSLTCEKNGSSAAWRWWNSCSTSSPKPSSALSAKDGQTYTPAVLCDVSTSRNAAGMHTRPLASSVPVIVEMNGRAIVLGVPGPLRPRRRGTRWTDQGFGPVFPGLWDAMG